MGIPLSTIERPEKDTASSEALNLIRIIMEDQMYCFGCQLLAQGRSQIKGTFEYIHLFSPKFEAAIRDSVKDFSSGCIATGLGDLGVKHIQELISMGRGERLIKEMQALTIDTLGRVARVDALFVVYGFQSPELAQQNFAIGVNVIISSFNLPSRMLSKSFSRSNIVQEEIKKYFSISKTETKEEIVRTIVDAINCYDAVELVMENGGELGKIGPGFNLEDEVMI